MQNPSSPLDTLRQLKEMLDAGALTPAEFEALKQRLVLQEPANTPIAPASDSPQSPPSLPPTPTPEPIAPTPMPIPVMPEELPIVAAPYETSAPAPFAPAGVTEPEPEEDWEPTYSSDAPDAPTQNSSLALILSIGGVLVFLALVAYLALNQAPSERLSSTSQIAADSVAAAIETGPQAEPLPPSTTVAETIRVVPSNPAPVVQPRPALSDSVALPATALDSVSRY